MKKLLLALFFTSFFGFSQNCKFEIDKIDDFTNNRILKTDEVVLAFEFNGNTVFTYFYLKDNIQYFGLKFSFVGHDFILVEENANILLLGNDKTVYKLTLDSSAIGKLKGNGGLMSSTDFDFIFESSENLYSFLEKGILKIRINTKSDYKDFEVKQKRYNKVLDYLKCFKSKID
jgi:hypothetical protein